MDLEFTERGRQWQLKKNGLKKEVVISRNDNFIFWSDFVVPEIALMKGTVNLEINI